jgi:outer membrane cobalamin receptor
MSRKPEDLPNMTTSASPREWEHGKKTDLKYGKPADHHRSVGFFHGPFRHALFLGSRGGDMKKITLLRVIISLAVAPWVRAENVHRLSPVTVTATRVEIPQDQVPAAITVITGEEIRMQHPQDLAQVLKGIVGLQVINWGPLGAMSTINIRGSTSGQVLVLLDGQRLNSAQSGEFNLANLPIAIGEIDRIEIIRGPASALYGQGAMAGVVHMITRRPHSHSQARVTLQGAQDKTMGTSLALSGKRGAVDFRASGSGETSDGYRKNSKHLAGRFEGQAGVQLSDRHCVEVGLNYLQKRSEIPGSRFFPQFGDTQQDQILRLFSRLQNEFLDSQLSTRLAFSQTKSGYEDVDAILDVKKSRHVLHTISLETQWEKSFGMHRSAMGGEVFLDALDSSDSGRRQQSQGSIFALYQVMLLQRVDVNLALRWDAYSDFTEQFNPRGLLAYRPSKNVRLRMGIGRAYMAPTLNDRFWPDDGLTSGNAGLSAEKAWEYESGLDLHFGDLGNANLSFFQRDVHDLIEWAQDSVGKWRPSNVGVARIRGMEAEVTISPFTWMRLSVNYTFLQPKNRLNGRDLVDRARHKLIGLGEISFWGELVVYLGNQYLDLVPDSKRLKDQFMVFDVGARYRWLGKAPLRWQITCKVSNLFDESYEMLAGYPMPPISPQVTFSVEF